ncbi:MAG: hypothetical protein JWM09_158 [Francisellaceae bacterium]|nr:hypothetical protein [Francisellaceae bacterium]
MPHNEYFKNHQRRYYYAYYLGPHANKKRVRKSDKVLLEAVKENLEADNWVDCNNIEVSVNQGIATLKGVVKTFLEKRAAGDDAADVYGIVDVKNKIKVQLAEEKT